MGTDKRREALKKLVAGQKKGKKDGKGGLGNMLVNIAQNASIPNKGYDPKSSVPDTEQMRRFPMNQ